MKQFLIVISYHKVVKSLSKNLVICLLLIEPSVLLFLIVECSWLFCTFHLIWCPPTGISVLRNRWWPYKWPHHPKTSGYMVIVNELTRRQLWEVGMTAGASRSRRCCPLWLWKIPEFSVWAPRYLKLHFGGVSAEMWNEVVELKLGMAAAVRCGCIRFGFSRQGTWPTCLLGVP